MSQSLLAAPATATGAVGAQFIPPTDPSTPIRNLQVNLDGSGTVSASVDVQVSLDGGAHWATLYTVSLSGTAGTDSQVDAVRLEGLWLRFNITAIAGTGAAVTALLG